MADPTVLSRDVVGVTVENTTVETNIFNYSIPANTIGATGILNLSIAGRYQKASATVADSLTLRTYLGATTLYSSVISAAAALSGVGREFIGEIWLANQNATNDQACGGLITIGTAGGATTGRGDISVDEIPAFTPFGAVAAAVDTTVEQAFRVSVQWDAATVSNSFNTFFSFLTLY